jgi:hypothetical protein
MRSRRAGRRLAERPRPERSFRVSVNLDLPSAAHRSAAWSQDSALYRRRIGLWGTIAFAVVSAVGMLVQV